MNRKGGVLYSQTINVYESQNNFTHLDVSGQTSLSRNEFGVTIRVSTILPDSAVEQSSAHNNISDR